MPFMHVNGTKGGEELDIAAMSMALSQTQVMQQASISVTKKAMDVSENQMQQMVEMMQGIGHQLNIKI